MKSSIKSIFNNIILFMSFITIVSAIAVLFTIEQNNSYKKMDILNEQKEIISTLKKIDKKDVELALIQFNGKSTELLHQTQKLHSLHEYDFIGTYILNTSDEYISQLDTLKELINAYNASAYLYYKSNAVDDAKTTSVFSNTYININKHISNIIFTNITYNKAKIEFMYSLNIGLLVLILLFSFIFYVKLKKIFSDLMFLQSPSPDLAKHTIYSIEADAIYLKMDRKTIKSQSISNLDPVTNLNNNKGLINSYAEKKDLKESNFTAMAIIEIDNFSKTNRTFPQDFIQLVLKKLATTISMYKQATDTIARSDYNEFTIILSRANKEKAFKEIDQIRQSIEELKFTTTTKVSITITVSGGFFIKPNNVSLSNAILETKSILEFAKLKGGNRISQKKDVSGVKI